MAVIHCYKRSENPMNNLPTANGVPITVKAVGFSLLYLLFNHTDNKFTKKLLTKGTANLNNGLAVPFVNSNEIFL